MQQYHMGLDGFVWFIGVVEDNNDPSKLGRVKVRCISFHTDDTNSIPTADLPWATVLAPTNDTSMQGTGEFSQILQGTWVLGFFLDAEEKQQPVVMGTIKGKPSKGYPFTGKGFFDPDKVNPQILKWSGHGTDKDNNRYNSDTQFIESDVNRLAKNEKDLQHKILEQKEDARTKAVLIANGESSDNNKNIIANKYWDEPSSTYAAVYPHNSVRETYGKHIKEYDDTEGFRRIHEMHSSGTFYEIDDKGNKVTRIVGDNYEVIAGGNFVNVKGDVNLTIDSNCNTYIKGNWNIQVDGTKTEVVAGAVSETYEDTKTEKVTGAVSETYEADQTTKITGNLDVDAAKIDLN